MDIKPTRILRFKKKTILKSGKKKKLMV